jgi:hypothetical protein
MRVIIAGAGIRWLTAAVHCETRDVVVCERAQTILRRLELVSSLGPMLRAFYVVSDLSCAEQ